VESINIFLSHFFNIFIESPMKILQKFFSHLTFKSRFLVLFVMPCYIKIKSNQKFNHWELEHFHTNWMLSFLCVVENVTSAIYRKSLLNSIKWGMKRPWGFFNHDFYIILSSFYASKNNLHFSKRQHCFNLLFFLFLMRLE
jgi:hypothetical protein